jgi:hypothetical protein
MKPFALGIIVGAVGMGLYTGYVRILIVDPNLPPSQVINEE